MADPIVVPPLQEAPMEAPPLHVAPAEATPLSTPVKAPLTKGFRCPECPYTGMARSNLERHQSKHLVKEDNKVNDRFTWCSLQMLF